MLDKDTEIKLNNFSKSIDSLNAKLNGDLFLLTNRGLSKFPYFDNNFSNFLSNKEIQNPSFFINFLNLGIYIIKNIIFILTWPFKKIIYNIISTNSIHQTKKNIHFIDIYILSKATTRTGKFHDRYLSELVKTLEKNDLDFCYILRFYQDSYNPLEWIKLYKILNNSRFHFITEYDLLTWRDLGKVITFFVKYPIKLLSFTKTIKIDEDVDKVVYSSIMSSLKDCTLTAYIRYIAGTRIAVNFPGSKILSYGENQPIEKAFYKGIKEKSINIKIYLYQQYFLKEKYGLTVLSDQESGNGFSPDKIIVNGVQNIPKKSVYNYMALAVRNPEVFKFSSRKTSPKTLVLLSDLHIDSINILKQVSNSSLNKKNLFIKLHPLTKKSVLDKFSNLRVLNSDLYSNISSTGIIIANKTGACLEAISMGVSIIIIQQEDKIIINPLINLGKGVIWDYARDSNELDEVFQNLMKNRLENFDEITKYSNEYKKLFYEKPTENLVLESFDFV